MHPIQFKAVAPNVFVWLDTCNVYVIKDGASAILIDIGDGLVLDALSQIGVTTVEWVLYTHHHREQCQGHPKLAGHAVASRGGKIAVPAHERVFLKTHCRFEPSYRNFQTLLPSTALAMCAR